MYEIHGAVQYLINIKWYFLFNDSLISKTLFDDDILYAKGSLTDILKIKQSMNDILGFKWSAMCKENFMQIIAHFYMTLNKVFTRFCKQTICNQNFSN